jgi:hypothetical protein
LLYALSFLSTSDLGQPGTPSQCDPLLFGWSLTEFALFSCLKDLFFRAFLAILTLFLIQLHTCSMLLFPKDQTLFLLFQVFSQELIA